MIQLKFFTHFCKALNELLTKSITVIKVLFDESIFDEVKHEKTSNSKGKVDAFVCFGFTERKS